MNPLPVPVPTTDTDTSELEFVPTPEQWATRSIDLTAWAGDPSVSVAFLNAGGWGNHLYLDNVRVEEPAP